MPHEVYVRSAGQIYGTKSFTFAGGELQVQVPGLPVALEGDVTVQARLQSADALVRLLLTTELLSRVHRVGLKRLVLPYFPYARQDRVMQPGEAFSLKAVARLINSLGFDEVVTCDPHSDVTPALVENIRVVPRVELLIGHQGVGQIIHSGITVVAPDAGATKKAFATAQHYGLPLITASKHRDVKTGTITRTELNDAASVTGRSALIVDDICDGGRTFTELARALREQGATRVYLYVTHGIFSQGLDVFTGLLDAIFTTDTFLSAHIEDRASVPLHISHLRF